VSSNSVEPDQLAEKTLGIHFWAALGGVYGLLTFFSLLRVPIPGVNEPHYLCKAKHFWDPQWCAGDLFLESSNPHLVFYATFGWLTTFLSLDTVAVVCRFIGLIPLAIGWHLLAYRLSRNAWASLLSLSFFLVLQSAGNWSGEWLVGGIESKVIAYGFLFWSIAQALVLKLPSSALLAGLAISFHPIVGVWGTLSAAMATLFLICLTDKKEVRDSAPPLKTWALAVLFFALAAAPGLVSAGQAVFSESDPDSTRIANLLQVGHRLGHHLDPMRFPKEAYRYFGLLIFLWLIIQPKFISVTCTRWWNSIVIASLIIAVIGVAIGWGPRPLKEMAGYEWRINALKFYPFRLADLLVPIAVSIAFASQTLRCFESCIQNKFFRNASIYCFAASLASCGLIIPASDQNPSKMSPEKRQNWIEMCDWVNRSTSQESLVHSFDNQWAVKWYCARQEYVNFKDCPQDAKSIIEWNQRRWVIARWKKNAFKEGGVSADELQELSEKTDVSIFICDRLGPFEMKPDYQNKDFRVYLVGEVGPRATLSGLE
jgi:hypothetical protein